MVATGISSVVTQLLTIREFLVQFNGNEFVIALILFIWLALGGVGTLMAGLALKKLQKASITGLFCLSLTMAAMPPIQILAIRFFRDIFFIPGSSVGFYPTLLFIFFTVAPYSLFLGYALPYTLNLIRLVNPDYSGACLYMTDNLGDMLGGALFSFVLVFIVTPIQALGLSGLILFASCLFLLAKEAWLRFSTILFIFVTLSILILSCFLETISLTPYHGELVHYRESRFGRIEVHKDKEQFTLFVEGNPLFSTENISNAEEAIHYPLAQIKKADKILLISAQGGMISELEKYKPEIVDYVEIDPKVTSALFRFNLLEKKPWLNIIHKDGRAFLVESDKLYDAIIINLPEPETFQTNRFFTDGFFALARDHLASNGVLSFSIQGFDSYLAEPQRQKLSSLYNTVKDYFNHVVLLPGMRTFFLCSNVPMKTDIPYLLEQKMIPTSYISGYYHGNLTRQRISYLNKLVDHAALKNHDTSPYLMRVMFSQWFSKFSTSPKIFFITLAFLTSLYLFFIKKEEFVLFSTGFMTMGSEIMVIFAFQIFFGYIYFQIGIIVTVFLAGLLPGAWLGNRIKTRLKGTTGLAIIDGVLIFLVGLFVVLILQAGDRMPLIFLILFGFAVSMACGSQFPLALNLRGDKSSAAASFFSADLMGAACGTLITSVVMIPYLGIVWTAAGLICLKLASLTIVIMSNGKTKQTTFPVL